MSQRILIQSNLSLALASNYYSRMRSKDQTHKLLKVQIKDRQHTQNLPFTQIPVAKRPPFLFSSSSSLVQIKT